MSPHTAEAVFHELRQLPSNERAKFFQLLGEIVLKEENHSHEQVFGHLASAQFTAAQAAHYLDVSMSTFRRYVQAKRINACTRIGRSEMYATKDLKAFKRARHEVNRS